MKKIIMIIGIVALNLSLVAQTAPFNVELESVSIPNLGGLQAFAFGQHNGKWLIVGGRLDGLHQRQPFAAFNKAGHNTQLIVIDPVAKQKWSAPLTSLPVAVQEQLSSTNMQFYQNGDYLYCVGGYGFSGTANDHTTYDKLTAITVSSTISAIVNGTSFTTHLRQISDSKFQVTGGKLKKVYNKYYLLGGQKFIGRYNPMGPGHGPGFIQDYSDEIRVFSLADNGTTLSVNHLKAYNDSVNLHRRDYNAEAHITANGEEGITMFSGVFQHKVDLPFLNSVSVDSNGYKVNNSFQQYYNHYHCAAIPFYSASNKEMHTVFFGGIAQYYDSSGVLVQDNNVPFVKTIARVSRDSSGVMAEYKLPTEMPALLGAGSEFIPNLALSHYNNEVFKLDEITDEKVLVGYIYGGISSDAPNIFFTNTGTQSSASSQIFKVYLTNYSLGVHDLNEQSKGSLNVRVYPNPSRGDFVVEYNLIQKEDVKIIITDINGKSIVNTVLKNQDIGENTYRKRIRNNSSGIYLLRVETSYEKITQKIIIE